MYSSERKKHIEVIIVIVSDISYDMELTQIIGNSSSNCVQSILGRKT